MMPMQSPCKFCPERGCGVKHDSCPEYQEFREMRAGISKQRAADAEVYGQMAQTHLRIWKATHKRGDK